jgi:GAF domain-containing protein
MSQKRSNRNRADQLALLDLISQSMGSETKTEEFLRQALTELQHRLNYKAVQIYRLSPYGQDVWLYLEGNEIEEGTKLPNIFSIEARNIISDTARKKQITYITNTQRGPYAIKTSELKPHIIRSEVALPLRKNVNSSVLGVLRIQSEQQADFPPADRQFLQSVARLLAITISHNQTVEQLENDLQEIKILYNLQRQKDIEGRDRNLNSDEEFGYTYNQTQLERRTVLSATSRLAAARHTITIGSTENETAGHEVAAPIQLYGETIGVLGVEREATDQEWSEDDIRLLEEVSDQVALALENARLIQQTRAQTQELTLLFAASQQLSETIDLNRIYNILTGQVITYLQADQCQVALFDASEPILLDSRLKFGQSLAN